MMTSEATEQVADWLRDSLGWAQAEFVSALAGGNSNLTWQFRDDEKACVVPCEHPPLTISRQRLREASSGRHKSCRRSPIFL